MIFNHYLCAERSFCKILLFFLIVLVCLALFCGCVSAEGTWQEADLNWTWYSNPSDDTFYIWDNKSLAALANITTYNSSTKDFKGKTIKLMSDINLSGCEWKPIGTNTKLFKGIFDGNGKTISNLTIYQPTLDYQGLFGYTNNAEIKNVNLTKVNVTGNNSVGSLVGCNFAAKNNGESKISFCNALGNVTGNKNVGILIGYNIAKNESNSMISYCNASGNVTGKNFYVGILIGYNYARNSGITKISFCNASGNVTGNQYIGSLVGINHANNNSISTILNCSASGNVNGDEKGPGKSPGFFVGGLIGGNLVRYNGKITISNCSALGNVNGNNTVGGLIAYNLVNEGGGNITISNCSASGTVQGIKSNVGGLVGANNVDEGEYGTIYINDSSAVNQYVKGNEKVGGLIGYNLINYKKGIIDYSCKIIISNCYAAVTDVIGNNYVGGLIGLNEFGNTVKDSSIYVTNTYSISNVSGKNYVGGLLGSYNDKGIDCNAYLNNSTALNKFVNGTSNVGRIIGGSNGKKTISLKGNYAWDGMKNGENFFTDNIGLSQINGENVSSIQVWANKTFYETNLSWDISKDKNKIWSIEADNGNNYPLPYITSLDKKDTWRPKAIHLEPVYVSFNNNSGNGTMKDQVFSKGVPQNLSRNNFTKAGHTFEGWSNTSNGEKVYDDEYSLRITSITTPKDITLYAVWKANITNITLNSSSADTPTYVVNITYNTSSFNKTLTVPTYAGHGFMGYNNSSTGGVQVINSELKLVPNALNYTNESGYWTNDTRNIELWAVWESDLNKLVNITFKANGGSGSDVNQTVVKNLSTALMNPGFIKEGCTLEGWNNKSASGTKVIYNVTDSINISKDTTLYAVWTQVTPTPTTTSTSSPGSSTTYTGWVIYTVYFDSCGGSHVDNQTDLYYGEKVKEPEDPTKDGYIFDAWYTADSYKWDFNNDTVKDKITLYAKWNSVEVQPTAESPAEKLPGSWFWIIPLIIAGAVITAVIIRKRRDKKRDEENFDVLS